VIPQMTPNSREYFTFPHILQDRREKCMANRLTGLPQRRSMARFERIVAARKDAGVSFGRMRCRSYGSMASAGENPPSTILLRNGGLSGWDKGHPEAWMCGARMLRG
jgi:hypothetical protein